jgi:elongator complex protein 1
MIDGTYQNHRFYMDVLKSTSLHKDNLGTVAVMDGNQILLTPFKKHNVPPPMSHSALKLASPALHLSFDNTELGQKMVVLLSNGSLEIWSGVDSKQSDIKLISTLRYIP